MNYKTACAVGICLMQTVAVCAQKALYIPQEWKTPYPPDSLLYAEVDTENKYTWSKSRSKESENFICYWDKYYTTEPTNLASSNFYHVDIDDLLAKAEQFYALNVGRLGFCDEATSKVRRYKMMILMNHTNTWTAYGGGYDFTIGALWLNPATCKPVGHTLAHEIGHSFQYMCYSDLGGHTGFHDPIGQGSTFWEQTAQWQAAQSFPGEKFPQSWLIFPHTANYAMTHEWMRYQSYWWHYFLAEKYGIDIVGRIWRHPMKAAADPNEAFMDLMGYDTKQLYREYFEYAMKMATLDLNVCQAEAESYIDTYDYNYVSLGGTKFQVAYSSCPQSTGFNVIPLNVPAAGTTVSTVFTSIRNSSLLATGDPAVYYNGDSQYVPSGKIRYNTMTAADYRKRGFRLGYVALMNDGTRRYFSEDSVYCQGTSPASAALDCTTSLTVPEGVKGLWMVVVPAPSAYFQHKWDDNISNDDQWPYTVEFTGTSIKGAPIISADRDICDATITYNVNLPKSTGYGSIGIKIGGEAASALGTAFQMNAGDVSSHLVDWASAGPADGEMMFYSLTSAGNVRNMGYTANGVGHWFTAGGTRCEYNNAGASLFSEFNPSAMTFTVGQYPSRLELNKTYKIGQAIKYRKGDREAVVRFIFNVTCKPSSTQASYTIADTRVFTPGDLDGDGFVTLDDLSALVRCYLGSETAELKVSDLNGDGKISCADLSKLIEQLNK